MTPAPTPRLFVAPGSLHGATLALEGVDAERIHRLGLRAGDTVVVLDNSGWEWSIGLDHVDPEACAGRVLGRRLAHERRTQVSLYQGLLHPSDFRRLLSAATALGAVAFVTLIADASMIPVDDLNAAGDTHDEWERLVRDAAEAGGRGRWPTIGGPLLLDHALDQSVRGSTVLLVHPDGGTIEAALRERPFSVDLFLPSPGGFSAEERARAAARGVAVVAAPRTGPDPVACATAMLQAVFALLEPGGAGRPAAT